MYQDIKRILYFIVAWYFRLFAQIRLRIWNPRVIVVTGSSGKTTLLHLIESQLGNIAKYSHHANSSIGIPFDILGLKRKTLTFDEWPLLFILAPVKLFTPLPKQKIYIVEADCDRPREGDFLSTLLNPEVTLWTNVSKTHVMNFEKINSSEVVSAISHEFGYFAERTNSLVITNGESELINKELKRAKCNIDKVYPSKSLSQYEVTKYGTKFVLDGREFKFGYLLPSEVSASILICEKLMKYLNLPFDNEFLELKLPPGRNSYFKGTKDVVIIDSTYNANLDSMTAILKMFSRIKSDNKWVVLGDMLELGSHEREEHENLAEVILKNKFKYILLMGPRISKYTFPILQKAARHNAVIKSFLSPIEVLEYLQKNISGEEVILFKGARFLEGVIEHLLLDKNDTAKLARREKIWEIRRKKWGLQ